MKKSIFLVLIPVLSLLGCSGGGSSDSGGSPRPPQQNNPTCLTGEHLSNGVCVADMYQSIFKNPTNTKTDACTGSETLTKIFDKCVRVHDGLEMNAGYCPNKTTTDVVTFNSPLGAFSEPIKNGQKITTCGAGQLLSEASSIPSNISVDCGTSAYSPGDLKCRLKIKKMSVNAWHACAIASDNNLYCWGYNGSGQLGDGTNDERHSPVKIIKGEIPENVGITDVSAGNDGTCAIGTDSLAYCWGNGSAGALGIGQKGFFNAPMAVAQGSMPPDKKIKAISLGYHNACAIASDDRVYCWGDAYYGRLGNGATTGEYDSPTSVDTSGVLGGKTVVSVSTSDIGACVTTSDGKAYCWGYNSAGRIGNGTTTQSASPQEVDKGGVLYDKFIKSISTQSNFTCAVAGFAFHNLDDQVYCWGNGANGELGDGLATGSLLPVEISRLLMGGEAVSRVTTGSYTSCALTASGSIRCWGSNASGELGAGLSNMGSATPVLINTYGHSEISGFSSVEGSSSSFCGISNSGGVYCWGFNGAGQLGDGTTSDSNQPKSILGGDLE